MIESQKPFAVGLARARQSKGKRLSSSRAAAALFATTLSVSCHAADLERYPSRPIRIVTSEIGGGLDFVARLVSQALTPNLGQQVIVDDRPSGVFTGSIVAKASPDGYTLLFNGRK
jgi:tripartite-type tricarboxylate transporter receptor subunit TctC